MKKLLFLLLSLLFIQSSYSQTGKGLSNTVDNSNYCYVAGYRPNLMGGTDMLVLKYDTYGDTLWTATYPGTDQSVNSQAVSIKTTIDGYVYVIGNIGNLNAGYDVVLLKYTSGGSLVWDRPCATINSNLEDKAFGIAVDESDNVYITGFSSLSGARKIFAVKYDSYGNVSWTAFDNNPDSLTSEGLAIALDHSGNACVTGFTTNANGGIDIITLKYESAAGGQMWYGIYNGTGNLEDKAFGIAVDESDNVYITGYANNDANGSNADIVLVKYNSAGTEQWRAIYDGGGDDKAFGLVIDASNAVYVTGYSNTVKGQNYITLKYDLVNGSTQWNTTYAGPSGSDKASSIGLIKNNGLTVGVVVTGSSVGTDNTEDFATVLYAVDNGTTVDSSRYSNGIGSNDVAMQLAVSDAGTVYVTGGSDLIVNARVVKKVNNQQLNWGSHQNHSSYHNVPFKYTLYQNYPNPFNPSTNIKFDLAKSSVVKLTIYDMLGRVVEVPINQTMQSGSHEFNYTNVNLSSGTYFYELKTEDFRDVKKMILIK